MKKIVPCRKWVKYQLHTNEVVFKIYRQTHLVKQTTICILFKCVVKVVSEQSLLIIILTLDQVGSFDGLVLWHIIHRSLTETNQKQTKTE